MQTTVPPGRSETAFWRSVAVIVGGTVAGQAISIVTLPLLTRLYPPNAFGVYAILTSASILLTTIVTLGLSSAVMEPETDASAEQIVLVAFGCSVALSAVIVVALLPFHDVLAKGAQSLAPWQLAVCLFLMTVVNSTSNLLRVYVNRLALNRVIATNAVIGSLCTLVVAIPLGLFGGHSFGLIVAGLVAGVACTVQMLHHANPFRHRIRWRDVTAILRRYRGYVLFQYPANLLETAGAQLPTQLLGRVVGSAQLASYSMNERLLGIPLRLVAAPLSTIYFRSISVMVRAGGDVAGLTFKIVSRVLFASLLPMAALILFAPELFSFALGRQWRTSGVLCAYLAPYYVLALCRASVSYCRVVLGQQRVNTVLSALRLVLAGFSLLLGHLAFHTLTGAVFAMSIGLSVFMAADMIANFVLLRKHLASYLMVLCGFTAVVVVLWYSSGAIPLAG